MNKPIVLNEDVLEDDYPIHYGYKYVVDGKVTTAQYETTVRNWKIRLKANEIRRCDIVGRVKLGENITLM